MLVTTTTTTTTTTTITTTTITTTTITIIIIIITILTITIIIVIITITITLTLNTVIVLCVLCYYLRYYLIDFIFTHNFYLQCILPLLLKNVFFDYTICNCYGDYHRIIVLLGYVYL